VQIGVEAGHAHVSLNCHVSEDTELSYRAYPSEGRLTFQIGGPCAEVTMFAHGEALDRLIFSLVAARNHLQAEHNKLLDGVQDAPIELYPAD
jgi:hypothetical protein